MMETHAVVVREGAGELCSDQGNSFPGDCLFLPWVEAEAWLNLLDIGLGTMERQE